MLTSELQRTSIGEGRATQSTSNTSASRDMSGGLSNMRFGLGERGFSNSSLGREKIDEEAMFSMEEDGDGLTPTGPIEGTDPIDSMEDGHRKRNGSNPLFGLGKSIATLGPIGGQRSGK